MIDPEVEFVAYWDLVAAATCAAVRRAGDARRGVLHRDDALPRALDLEPISINRGSAIFIIDLMLQFRVSRARRGERTARGG